MNRRFLGDSGVLLRFVLATSTGHAQIESVLQGLLRSGAVVGFSPQGIRETWNVLTRPRESNGYGVSIADAESLIQGVSSSFVLFDDSPQVYAEWRRLATLYGLIGKSVHDANMVASALAHGATEILTLNEKDFRRYREITVVNPLNAIKPEDGF